MSHVKVKQELDLEEPYLVEGLLGVGLVGKIAADHMVEEFDMSYYAACECDGLPDVATFDEGTYDVNSPVRIFADEENDLLVLQSDVPVSPTKADCFAGCLTDWLDEIGATPVYLSGLPVQRDADEIPSVYGVSTDDPKILEEHEISTPEQDGVISGPTGALLNEANESDVYALGLITETDPQFPDPAASRVLLKNGIEPITGVKVDTDELVEKAEQITEAKERLAKQMQQATDDESSRAAPVGMYQ
ncbi:MAG: proteasome assembly chaperone family protein [Halobacteria archaeon]|nr:proteasome assembly chaperone family protein [Halobacteria archaeon]